MNKEFLHGDLKKENDEYSDNTMINVYTTTNNIESADYPYNMDDIDMDEIIIHDEEDADQFYDTDTDDTISTTTTSSSISTETEVYIDSLKNRDYFKVTKENSMSFEELLDLMRSSLLNDANLLNNEENIVDADVIKVNDDINPETVGVKGSDQGDQVN